MNDKEYKRIFQQMLKEYGDLADQALAGYFQPDGHLPEDMLEVMKYSVFAGGKRLRPALLMASCEAFGGSRESALPFACAAEMIHTFSLIHDDLPALDNDDLRRGKPSCHKRYGEARALLAGDSLLSYAFEILLSAASAAEDPRNALAAAREIAHGVGVGGMMAGQWQDVCLEPAQIGEKELQFIHLHKTAAFIRSALQAGALLAGASKAECDAIARYGTAVGLSFQITDDILDACGTAEKLGKNVGVDRQNGKTTFVSLYGVEGARKRVEELTQSALRDAETFDRSGFFAGMACFVRDREF